jgi:uncharacterized protein YllA (UPF0747 family)
MVLFSINVSQVADGRRRTCAKYLLKVQQVLGLKTGQELWIHILKDGHDAVTSNLQPTGLSAMPYCLKQISMLLRG